MKVYDKMFDDFLKDVRAKSFVITDLDIEKNRDFIKSFMKADIIKALNGEDSGERILVEEDELVKRAMDIFRAAELMNGGKAVAK